MIGGFFYGKFSSGKELNMVWHLRSSAASTVSAAIDCVTRYFFAVFGAFFSCQVTPSSVNSAVLMGSPP
ncbi:MAG: hypothetical protein ACRDCV_04575, partial [Plesiomonas shigelloides]